MGSEGLSEKPTREARSELRRYLMGVWLICAAFILAIAYLVLSAIGFLD